MSLQFFMGDNQSDVTAEAVDFLIQEFDLRGETSRVELVEDHSQSYGDTERCPDTRKAWPTSGSEPASRYSEI